MEDKDSLSEQLEEHVKRHTPWDQLPSAIKQLVGNSREIWRQSIVRCSLKHQLRWKTGMVRNIVTDERAYYLELIRQSRNNLMLYPYHISDVLVKGLRITPFKYYLEMMFDVMMSERSYDVLPNFTAADGVRLLGIGRNQFIDIMNKWRSKSWLKKKETAIKELLPTQPVKADFAYWWLVHIGFVSEEDVRNSTAEEHSMIDDLIDHGPKQAGELDRDIVCSLYNRGLVYVSVPIYDDDQIIVPPLEGFVMNRVQGDYFENLLYKIFVSIDERTTMLQLANILQVDVEQVKHAVSMYILLGFATKKTVEPLVNDSRDMWLGSDDDEVKKKTKWHPSWLKSSSGPVKTDSIEANRSTRRIGLIFDSSLTAFLMMGNLAQGLKSHAVTMFEVGKLADESLDDFLNELEKVDEVSEGEAQTYFDHAITLKNTLRFLRYNKDCMLEGCDGGVDLLRCERLKDLEPSTRMRILNKNYAALLSMAPISPQTQTITSCSPPHFGPNIWEINSPWMRLYLYDLIKAGPPSILYPRGRRVTQLPEILQDCEKLIMWPWDNEPEIVSASNLLTTLNDSLLVTPVFIQAYSVAEEPIIVDVAFPVDPISEIEKESNVEGKQYNESNMHTHPIVQEIQKKLNLQYSTGFIRMIKFDEEDKDWTPFNVDFGVPLFGADINQKVCKKIQQYQLFNKDNLKNHSKHTRDLCLRLLDFISKHEDVDIESELDYHVVPYPSHEVTFMNNKLYDEL